MKTVYTFLDIVGHFKDSPQSLEYLKQSYQQSPAILRRTEVSIRHWIRTLFWVSGGTAARHWGRLM